MHGVKNTTVSSYAVASVRAKLARSATFCRKRDSKLMRFFNFLINTISSIVWVLSFHKTRMYRKNEFMNYFRTTIGNKVYLLDSDFDNPPEFVSEGVQIHELVHVNQKASDRLHGLRYVFSRRARYNKEMEAYKVQIGWCAINCQYDHAKLLIYGVVDWLNGGKYFWAHNDKKETKDELDSFLAKTSVWLNDGPLPGDTLRINSFMSVMLTTHRNRILDDLR